MDFELPNLPRFSFHCTVYFKAEDLPTFWKYFTPAYEAVVQESELLYMEVFEDPSEPGKVSWIENWEGTPDWFLKVSKKLR